MRSMKWCVAAVLAFAVGASAALADPGGLLVLGKRSASGAKAHAVAVVPTIPAHRYDKLTLEVDAKPRQKVRADYIGSCARDGIGGSRPSGQKVGRTPLSITLDLDPYYYADYCNVTVEASLLKKGRVTVQLVARP
jgi:hypothetical protein